MSRLVFPTDFSSQADLLMAIDAKNTADGAASPLKSFLIQQKIGLAAAKATFAKAQIHDTNRTIYIRQADNYRQWRDLKFEPIFSNIRKSTQFLISVFGNNNSELGEFGIKMDAKGRITYPTSFAGRKRLFDAFYKKHTSYPAGNSPLDIFLAEQNINMAYDNTAVQYANGCEASCMKTTKLAENETQVRDNIWQPVIKILRQIGELLENLLVESDHQLALWGFTIENTNPQPEIRTTKLKLGEQKCVNAIVVGTTLQNIGAVDIVVYKGKIQNGTSAVIKPGEKLGIEKGWNNAVIVNTSKLESAVYQMTVAR